MNFIATLLGERSDFRIFTRDRDLGDERPYADVAANTWVQIGNNSVYYASKPLVDVFSVIRRSHADVLYLNSFFDPRFAILPVLLARLLGRRGTRIIIAPRGEFSEGALKLKRLKKQLFIALARASRLYHNLVWHASTELEAADIRRIFGPVPCEVCIAQDASSPEPGAANASTIEALAHDREPLRLCFISRISRKKNLDYAISIVRELDLPTVFDVYGPVEDPGYMTQCRALAATVPEHVDVRFHGPAGPPARVPGACRAPPVLFSDSRRELWSCDRGIAPRRHTRSPFGPDAMAGVCKTTVSAGTFPSQTGLLSVRPCDKSPE